MRTIAFALLGVAGLSLAAPPPADVLTTLEFNSELQWYYRNDVGMLLIYADDQLYRVDLLADEPAAQESHKLPNLADKHSVLPVARTGLLLLPTATLNAEPGRSYAIDTLTGEVVWQAPALPGIDQLFAFPDAGLAVLRSPDNGGRLLAVDLLTGERVWELPKWARMIWTDAPYIRAVVENTLLTLDIYSGETVRADGLSLPESKRTHIYSEEGVILQWNNREFTGYSIPPTPPAAAAPPQELWSFKAGSLMIDRCISIGNCRINRIGDDLLLISSATKNELIRLTTGALLTRVKKGMFGVPISASSSGECIAAAASKEMRILDGNSGKLMHEIDYPRGGEGMKSLRYLSWPTDDLVITVFPDKKGNPRKMIGYSCSNGSLAWSVVLPEIADYLLTSEQKERLVGRIVSSLIMTAVSVANPVSVGGYNYAAVFVPNLDVSESFATGMSPTHSGESAGESPFAAAQQRYKAIEGRIDAANAASRYFVAGPKKRYEVLKIGLTDGSVAPVARYEADTVHVIIPFPGFGRALTLENDNTRMRLLRIE